MLARVDIHFVENWSERLPGVLCAEDDAPVAVLPFRDEVTDDERQRQFRTPAQSATDP